MCSPIEQPNRTNFRENLLIVSQNSIKLLCGGMKMYYAHLVLLFMLSTAEVQLN